tara:strand:+ start:1103 stop:1312 length:210 start_codon:yes stop_codon:yes gene_type:complete
MIVLKAKGKQFDSLEGFRNGDNLLKFAKDANNNWIVGLEVLEDSAFVKIHDDLNELERIEYVPIPEEIE